MQDLKKLASKWQKKWAEAKIFTSKESSKKKYYVLEMFPYPSGSGLHMGHARNYVIGDVVSRCKRMQGFNVLYPMGYDAFGLPAENAAIKAKTHPREYTEKSIKTFIKQQQELGLSYDWSRIINTSTKEYYKWNQWFFIQFFKKGLAYKKKASVNWCPECNTVLANEQVHSGKCWRHKETDVEEKQLEQWFFKIKDYADELLDGLEELQWPERIKAMQRNWIGKSKGVEIYFTLEGTDKVLPTFTTRCDTIFSVTFLAIAPESPLATEFTTGTKYEQGARDFINKVKRESLADRTNESKAKEGFFTGKYAINPVNKEKIPIYIANFALMYGSGVVMCDAHDKRDFAFARKYDIPLKFVISKDGNPADANKAQKAYTDDGLMFGSGEFDGLTNKEALPKMATWLEKKSHGKQTLNYKLKDWLISRQRYWGTPIPIIYCDKCGILPVQEKDLPVLLPEDVEFGHGNPLATNKDFVNTTCPKCKGKATRETDTMDTFVDSSWYFLRYCDAQNNKEPFNKKIVDYWMPVDQYIGGAEHATMHLIYSRFFTKVLKDLKLVNCDEPFPKLFNQGMLHKDGVVMSKSKGNVITQEDMAKKYSIDTARIYLMSMASPDKDIEWNDKDVDTSHKFLQRIVALWGKKEGKLDRKLEHKMHSTIKRVTEDISNFQHHEAVRAIVNYVHFLTNHTHTTKENKESLALLLTPFTPHLAEELWEALGKKPFISLEKWPSFNEKKIDPKIDAEEELMSNIKADVDHIKKITNIKPKQATLVVAESWKYTFFKDIRKSKSRDPKEIMQAITEKQHLKEGMKLVQGFTKGNINVNILFNQKEEVQAIKDYKAKLEKEMGVNITVETAEKSKEQKAKNALPGKPAIILE